MINIKSDMILCILFNYHILYGFPTVQIRKLSVPDLLSGLRRAAAQKHNMCHAISCVFLYMLCLSPSP
ncbi:hypothetical protein B9P84_20540 [Citrobacter braakii]|nr:hypothetical protein DPF84_25880 [Enterobacter hormaechei]OXU09965.1 hypothetical protein B9P84_20540 [Citrobacter braakii]OZP66283.1 hypothetical protein CIG53_20100 [Enterobacter asburiae]QBB08388.1 hypothetical protein EVV94_26045 [Enterobacter cloacae]RAM40703.1 hypothetical protein DOZ52_22875 [Enterobacter hormaechei]